MSDFVASRSSGYLLEGLDAGFFSSDKQEECQESGSEAIKPKKANVVLLARG